MPILYKGTSIVQSHLHTRKEASLFDVSHMGQLKVYGRDRVAFLESVLVSDLASLGTDCAKLSLLTNATGGILDDCVITNLGECFFIVLNAGNTITDMAHFQTQLSNFSGDVRLELLEDRALLALQGPKAVDALNARVISETRASISALPFMTAMSHVTLYSADSLHVLTEDALITRCGYTGEDGFELSVPSSMVEALATDFCDTLDNTHPRHANTSNVMTRVWPAGLGARDSLRLEAGLCLHGHDIGPWVTPLEAGLSWTIGKHRRTLHGATFTGGRLIAAQLAAKKAPLTQKRIGFVLPSGSLAAREGASLYHPDDLDTVIGTVTSGTVSPCLKYPIGMALVKTPHFKLGTALVVKVRQKIWPLVVVKMPFVPPRYFQGL